MILSGITMGALIIAIFILIAVMLLMKTISFPKGYYTKMIERNEIRKRIIQSQIPIEEELPTEEKTT